MHTYSSIRCIVVVNPTVGARFLMGSLAVGSLGNKVVLVLILASTSIGSSSSSSTSSSSGSSLGGRKREAQSELILMQ